MGSGPDRKPRKKRTDNPVPPPNYKGRNRGSCLPRGAVGAIRAAKRRVPEDATDEERAIAQEAFDRVVDVMRGEVRTIKAVRRTIDAETGETIDEGETITVQSPQLVLTAAKMVREDICTPHALKVDVSADAETVELIREARLRARKETDDGMAE